MRTLATPAPGSGRLHSHLSACGQDRSAGTSGRRSSSNSSTGPVKANGHEFPPYIDAVLTNLDTCYLLVNRGDEIVEASSRALDWLQMRREDVIGREYRDVIYRSSLKIPENAVQATLFSDRQQQHYDHPRRRVDLHTYPVGDGAIIFFRDISEQKIWEQNAARTRPLLEGTLDALSAHVVVLDGTGAIVASNLAWRRFSTAYGLVNTPIDRRVNYLALYSVPMACCPEAERIKEALSSLLVGRKRATRLVYAWHGAEKTLWFQLSGARFESEGEPHLVVVNEDVTAMKEARQMLGEAAAHLSHLKDEERRRIAEELHDSTAQHLVAAGLNVMGLKARIETDPVAVCLVREIDASLDAAIKEVRAVTYLLQPPGLEKDALSTTLSSYVRGFDERTGLKTRLRVSRAVDELPATLRRAVFQIIQEALARAHRHVSVSRVSIDLRCMLRRLHLIVSDDGGGANRASSPERTPRCLQCPSIGVTSLRAQLRQFDGELRVASGPEGTTLHAMVPMHAALMAPASGPADDAGPD